MENENWSRLAVKRDCRQLPGHNLAFFLSWVSQVRYCQGPRASVETKGVSVK